MTHHDDVLVAMTTLLEETGKAHHQAFLSQDGDDPEWARWYADYAHDRIEALLDIAIGESDLAALFEEIEEQRRRDDPDAPWARYYAQFFTERYGEGE